MIFAGRIETTCCIQSLFATRGLDMPFAIYAQATRPPIFYHWRLALALERITVAIKFIVNTNTNKTSAVPY